MAKRNLFIVARLILLVGLFVTLNSCDSCRNGKASSTGQASFEIALEASKSELLPSEESVVTLTILSNDNRAASLEYFIGSQERNHNLLLPRLLE
jgi:hypothetical protein